MKTRRHYFFTFRKRTTSRMYGGENYTLAVFQNKGVGNFVFLGEREGCTRGHRGFESEAWSVVMAGKTLGRIKKEILADPGNEHGRHTQYYTYTLGERFGVKLEQM